MNAQKYTQKSLEAVQNAQSIATEYGNQQIEQPHLLLALLLDERGLIPQLLGNMGLTVPSFTAAVKAEVEKLPRVSGSGREQGKIYVAQDVDRALNAAESTAASKEGRVRPILVSRWGTRPFSAVSRARSRWACSICWLPYSVAMDWAAWMASRDFWVYFCAFMVRHILSEG